MKLFIDKVSSCREPVAPKLLSPKLPKRRRAELCALYLGAAPAGVGY